MNGISFETALTITCLIVGVPALAAWLAQLWGWWLAVPGIVSFLVGAVWLLRLV